MNKYIYIVLIIAVFATSSLIVFYRSQAIEFQSKYYKATDDYNESLVKIEQQERSIAEYKKSIREQTEKLTELNIKKITYEKDYNELKETLDLLNIDAEIKNNPQKINVLINKTINDKFKKIEDATK